MSCTKPAPINAARSTKKTIRTHCVVVSPLGAMAASPFMPFILTPLLGAGHINDIKGCPTFTLGDAPARFTRQLGPNIGSGYLNLFIFTLFIAFVVDHTHRDQVSRRSVVTRQVRFGSILSKKGDFCD